MTRIYTIIDEKLKKDGLSLNNDEPITIKGEYIYFVTEKNIGKNDIEEKFWQIDYTKEKKEGNTVIAEKYNIEEMKSEGDYLDKIDI